MSYLLEFAEMARSTFYYHRKRMCAPDKWEPVRRRIAELYHHHKGRYGVRRITLALRSEGVAVNHKTVEKLMGRMGLKSLVRVKRYRSYKGQSGTVAPNVVNRNFRSHAPCRKLATDVTEFSLFGKKLYLSPVMDMYNGEILCHTISSHPTLEMVTSMVDRLGESGLPLSGALMHSDQGWHYQHKLYRNALKELGIVQSMSRKGNCLDNAVMENFFGTLKSELLYLRDFNSMDEFRSSLEDYIDYYNKDRIKLRLGTSPVKYRERHLNTVSGMNAAPETVIERKKNY